MQGHSTSEQAELRLHRHPPVRTVRAAVAMLMLICVSVSTWAQSLPPPSRTVFKCEVGGKINYSDSPCLGAQKIEVEPTRGVSKLSGSERVGNDVRREQHREIMAEALKPLTGMDAKQLDTYARRMRLSPDAQRDCKSLDVLLPDTERSEKLATGQELSTIHHRLLALRSRYRELGC